MYAYGKALGEEYHDKGINIALGPVAGPLGRIAKGGRNWEGLSNDPYLAGIGMYEVTKAMQDAGVIAVAKVRLPARLIFHKCLTHNLALLVERARISPHA